MPRSELTKKFQIAEGMVEYVRENLDEVEYNLFLDMIAPLSEPEPQPTKKSQKKTGRKLSSSSSKSSRAASLNTQLKSRVSEQRETPKTTGPIDDMAMELNGGSPARCGTCGNDEDYQDHFKPSPNYHEFDTGKSLAPPAPTRSPANGASSATERSTRRSAPLSKREYDETDQDALSSIVDSVDGTDDASTVAHGVSGDD